MKILLLLVCAIAVLPVKAQKLSITRIDLSDGKLTVSYTLDDLDVNHTYRVSLHMSKDNFAMPLTKVSGDVGLDVKPGAEKKIEWNITEEIGEHEGMISLEVRAGVFIPFVKLNSFDGGKKYKRGKTYPLLWTSGNMGGQIDIDLYNGQNRVQSDRAVPNTGKYEFSIPGSVKAGKYTLRFTNIRNRDEFIVSPEFSIVPKYPFALKAGLAALVGSGLYLIMQLSEPAPAHQTTSNEIEMWPTTLPSGN